MNAATSQEENCSLDKESFAKFARFITSELGIKMPATKVSMLQGRLRKRMRALGLASIVDYQTLLFKSKQHQEELVHFIDAVTTNKTDFFREPDHFRALTEEVLPGLDKKPGAPWSFHLWCAGSSTGEEPYTLAMVLSDYAQQRAGFDYSIFATDISSQVLATAKRAIYKEDRIQTIPTEYRKRYLLRSRDPSRREFRITAPLRSRVSFDRLNFMDKKYSVGRRFDVIFFRNVMIYFDKKTQESVINKLAERLKPGGCLFVGHSESLTGLDIPFAPIGASLYRKLEHGTSRG